jgi:hypothetical protein
MNLTLYDGYILFVVIMKLLYLCIALITRVAIWMNLDKNMIDTLKVVRDDFLLVDEIFMYIVLIIVFYPFQHPRNIQITKEEQIIIFTIGILGLIHTNWDKFKWLK